MKPTIGNDTGREPNNQISADMGNFIHVNNYVLRAEHTPDLDSVVKAKLRAAAGLVHLDQKEYGKVRTLCGAVRFLCCVSCASCFVAVLCAGTVRSRG